MMSITIFAATSERDNSQALVMGSCLLGEDGGNRWELECARLVRVGQRRKCRCVLACARVRCVCRWSRFCVFSNTVFAQR